MARIKKPIVVASQVIVSELLMQLGLQTGTVNVDKYVGLTYSTAFGRSVLEARASLKDGFTVSFFSHMRRVATVVGSESLEAQELFDSILQETAANIGEGLAIEAKSSVAQTEEAKSVSAILVAFKGNRYEM